MSVMSKIKNIVTFARITLASDDSGTYQIFQTEGIGKPINTVGVLPYGLSANAPAGSTVVKLNAGSSAQNSAGIPFNPENRFRDLKEWEVKVGNFKTKANLYFEDDGSITLKAGDDGGDIRFENTDGSGSIDIKENGDVVLNDGEDFGVRFSELKSGFDELVSDFNSLVSSFNSHIHTTTATVGSSTTPGVISPTTSTESPSGADVDDSKIEDVKVP